MNAVSGASTKNRAIQKSSRAVLGSMLKFPLTHPQVIICLGATAAQALLGKEFSVMRQRGKFVASDLAPYVMATVHPSSILRAQDDNSRRQQKEAFIEDLKAAASQIR